MSEMPREEKIAHQARLVRSSLEFASYALAQEGDEEVRGMVDWIAGHVAVGHTQPDPRNLSMTRVMRPVTDGSTTTAVFVEKGDATARNEPALRQRPQYIHNIDSFFSPAEVLVHPAITAAVTIHEGVHAEGARNPKRELARETFPSLPLSESLVLVEEVRAFDYEGRLLSAMLGPGFQEYLQVEIDETDKNAVQSQKQHSGMLIEAGVEGPIVKEYLKTIASILDPEAERFCLELLATALPTYVGFRALDQIIARNASMGLTEADIMRLKFSQLVPAYLK